MKRQIRECVFETASSSVHVLFIKGKLGKNKLKMKDGYVLADFGEFGKEDEIYLSQNDKLSYLITELYYVNHLEVKNIEDMYQFEYIEEAIMDYDSNVLGVKILGKKKPFIDHQSQPEFSESKFVDYWDKKSIQNFIFNNNIGIQTGCD